MSFTCPICKRTSFNPNDEREKYCANCHAYMGEIGRELKPSEMKERTIVWARLEGRNEVVSVWVKQINHQSVHFYAGNLNITLAVFLENDELCDIKGRVIHVYEYLGEDQVA